MPLVMEEPQLNSMVALIGFESAEVPLGLSVIELPFWLTNVQLGGYVQL